MLCANVKLKDMLLFCLVNYLAKLIIYEFFGLFCLEYTEIK